IICPELHYSPYAHDWWLPRPTNNKDNTISVPYRLHMHIGFTLNQHQFFIRVVKGEENLWQPEFICVSNSEISKVCSMPSQIINTIYHMIFGKKTAYFRPLIIGFNDKQIVEKLLNRIRFRPLFLNIENFIVVHYKDKSANGIWAQVGITMHLDGALYGFNHLLVQHVQHAIQESLANVNLTCTSQEWDDIIYPPTYKLNETELHDWRAMLQACGCINMTLYPKTNDRKEFWSRSSDPTIDKANLKNAI
ncbi:9879_t:CDS:2, partial [Cetraspora pellucida]